MDIKSAKKLLKCLEVSRYAAVAAPIVSATIDLSPIGYVHNDLPTNLFEAYFLFDIFFLYLIGVAPLLFLIGKTKESAVKLIELLEENKNEA